MKFKNLSQIHQNFTTSLINFFPVVGEMPYKCLICSKEFTFQQSYHKHLMYHNDDKPYVCRWSIHFVNLIPNRDTIECELINHKKYCFNYLFNYPYLLEPWKQIVSFVLLKLIFLFFDKVSIEVHVNFQWKNIQP